MSTKHPQSPIQIILFKFRLFLLYSFPVVLFCSYYPLIPIATSSSTHYELSLPLIWLLLFSVLSLKDFFLAIYNIYKKHRLYLLAFLFPIYLSASIIWSANPLRAFITAGVLWCIIITSITILSALKPAEAFNKSKFLKIFFFSTTVFCMLCWIQSILDCFEVDRSITLLCSGCTSYSFGFPHPSGLAIEPQFMGNLLIAPTLVALYYWTKSHQLSKKDFPFSPKTLLFFSFLFSSTLFLTFSRGAIYSFTVAFAVLFIVSAIRFHQKQFWKTIPLLILSFLFTLFAQGLFSSISYTNSTFASGIERSISQLSLGKINLELSPVIDLPGTDNTDVAPDSSETPITPVFDGYVEESTDVRMTLNGVALELASKSPTTMLFGYGLGSAGEVMLREEKTSSAYEIIQNEYLSLLFEVGIIGLFFAMLTTILIVKAIKKNGDFSPLIATIILGFLLSLLFFSGLPNAIHLYLFPTLLLASLPSHRPVHSSSKTSPAHLDA